MRGKLCQAPQILRGGRERELELGAPWTAQSQAAKAQDAL
jgi:hypothetical protein